jgi:hypothetical protein
MNEIFEQIKLWGRYCWCGILVSWLSVNHIPRIGFPIWILFELRSEHKEELLLPQGLFNNNVHYRLTLRTRSILGANCRRWRKPWLENNREVRIKKNVCFKEFQRRSRHEYRGEVEEVGKASVCDVLTEDWPRPNNITWIDFLAFNRWIIPLLVWNRIADHYVCNIGYMPIHRYIVANSVNGQGRKALF